MLRKKSDLKIILLQIRHEKHVQNEEFESFVRYSGLNSSQIDILNVYDSPTFDLYIVDSYDALFVGGTSNANVLKPEKYPFVPLSQDLIKYCIEKEIPVFASCFGFQLAVLALNGEIIHQENDFEMGVIDIKLTPHAIDDTLFRNIPDNFSAISVHQQLATKSPPNSILLAYTDQCVHSFKVEEKPFWAFQFHPEVDKQTLIERLTIYKSKYTNNDGHLDEVLRDAKETPYSNILLKNFTDEVLLKN